jgi:intracellular sulfur oxidation DsrE/DsrF family protein
MELLKRMYVLVVVHGNAAKVFIETENGHRRHTASQIS